jgi:hypothetical protein
MLSQLPKEAQQESGHSVATVMLNMEDLREHQKEQLRLTA